MADEQQPDVLRLAELRRLHAVEQQRDDLAERLRELSEEMVFEGNSVAFIYQKMKAYRSGIDEVWATLKEFGVHPDGKTSSADAIRAALSRLQAGGGECVGEVGMMPGTSGFTMVCFRADKVPVGTKLYTRPAAPAKVLVPLPPKKVREVCSGIFLSDHPQGSSSYDQALADALSEALATHNGLTLDTDGEAP